MWKRIKKWFFGPTLEEAYFNGRSAAQRVIEGAIDKQDGAAYLYALSDGVFDSTPASRAFDEGIQDELEAMGFKNPMDTE